MLWMMFELMMEIDSEMVSWTEEGGRALIIIASATHSIPKVGRHFEKTKRKKRLQAWTGL